MSQDTGIKDMHRGYETHALVKDSADKNPFRQFQLWMNDVLAVDFAEPDAMNIATVNKAGDVSSRMVLLKSFNEQGFVFFTNYASSKADDLATTHQAALNFWWDKLYRQVRINGSVEKIPRKQTLEYFHSRPRASQIGAVASEQSRIIENYSVLADEYSRIEALYEGREIPCPEHWGGYRVIPAKFEFWQGRPNRLHDRLCYVKSGSGNWKIERLSP